MSETRSYPPGEYAIVELFGHTTLVGRIAEVERFGARMMALEPLYRDELLPPVLHGGTAIYRLTPCPAEVAYARQPREAWQIPVTIRSIVPAALLAPPPGAESRDPLADALDDGSAEHAWGCGE